MAPASNQPPRAAYRNPMEANLPNHRYPPDALSSVVAPVSGALPLAAMQSAWERLKAARGEPITRPHLLAPAHLIAPAAPTPSALMPVAAAIARHQGGVVAYVRQGIADGTIPVTRRPGGA